MRLAFWVRCLLGLATGFVMLLLYGPVAVSTTMSFFPLERGTVIWREPSLEAYRKLASNVGILEALVNSLVVGGFACLIAVASATLFSLYYHQMGGRMRQVLQLLIFLPFLMPPIVTGLSLLIYFREVGVPRSLVTVTIGHVLFVLALTYRVILMRLQSISHTLIEAAFDLGANWFQAFFYVIFPNLRSAMLVSGILAFGLSFDETMITILVTGTENTLPIRLWAMMRLGMPPDINALVLLVVLFSFGLCLVVGRDLVRSSP